MPNMDGFECARKILKKVKEFNQRRRPRENESMPLNDNVNVTIVALSSFTEDSMKNKARGVGMSDYMTKPIMIEELERIMNRYVFNE